MPKRRGLPRENDRLHYVVPAVHETELAAWIENRHRIFAPILYTLPDGRRVPQWAKTVRTQVNGFNPAVDCDGYFTSYKYQPNNNCYNYACNIASNSFAQPGRIHGKEILQDGRLNLISVIEGAEADGLLLLGDANEPLEHVFQQISMVAQNEHGHLVALLISQPECSIRWRGDYHWIRCDSALGDRWSQKDGADQVTNYDFSGNLISDPAKANWSVNLGPYRRTQMTAKYIEYTFAAWMYVPYDKVEIV